MLHPKRFTLADMHLTSVMTCPNCRADLETDYKFCPTCGQNAHIHRFNLSHVFHEVFHALTHADKGMLHLIKELALRPGVVAREYVLEGKRKKYFNPFTFVALTVGLIVFTNSIFHPQTRNLPTNGPSMTQQYDTEQERLRTEGFRERRQTFQTFIEKRGNIVLFLAIPILAFVYYLFFRRTGINYAEHLVAHVFFTGFYGLLLAFILTPTRQFLPGGNLSSLIQLLVHVFYLTFAYYRFLPAQTSYKLAKTGLAAFLSVLVWGIISAGSGALYIAFG